MLTQRAIELAIPQLQSSVAIPLFLCKDPCTKTVVWSRYSEAGEWLVSHSQTLFPRRGVIAFRISVPLERGAYTESDNAPVRK